MKTLWSTSTERDRKEESAKSVSVFITNSMRQNILNVSTEEIQLAGTDHKANWHACSWFKEEEKWN
ncbi:hypothetical protein [Thalassobacillus sp. C254]|uniref:hypothetical protein n=1 Tax=Thalassobacillus sp. C254 TaxID=1225341 RepID=UPI0006D12E75|nr:hypothetical protein [Thalassobacillus sp. C254]